MGTKKRFLLGASVAGLLCTGAAAWAGPAISAQALVNSSGPAGVFVLPKVAVDTILGRDTLVEIANTTNAEVTIHCFYTETSRCEGSGLACQRDADCADGEACVPLLGTGEVCNATDFTIRLTAFQPIGFLVSAGLNPLPCDPDNPSDPNDPNPCDGPGSNEGFIPARDPFLGKNQVGKRK